MHGHLKCSKHNYNAADHSCGNEEVNHDRNNWIQSRIIVHVKKLYNCNHNKRDAAPVENVSLVLKISFDFFGSAIIEKNYNKWQINMFMWIRNATVCNFTCILAST